VSPGASYGFKADARSNKKINEAIAALRDTDPVFVAEVEAAERTRTERAVHSGDAKPALARKTSALARIGCFGRATIANVRSRGQTGSNADRLRLRILTLTRPQIPTPQFLFFTNARM
jgi:hypothetical protein